VTSIVSIRRITQAAFLLLFLWLCAVMSLGTNWWQLRGWPVNIFLQLDPLAALSTLLSTGTLYRELFWAAGTVVLTILLGRFFCGWVCPFGTLHQFVGWLHRFGKPLAEKTRLNGYRPAQAIKYYILFFFLCAAAGTLLARLTSLARDGRIIPWIVVTACLLTAAILAATKLFPRAGRATAWLLAVTGAWTALAVFFPVERLIAGSVQTGLLDPIPLAHRSVHLALLPVADRFGGVLSAAPRQYTGALLIGAVFIAALGLNLWIPRFYCRFICPLGALFGLFGRFAFWRVGKTQSGCSMCSRCEANCEGACEPDTEIRISECVLCMNCLRSCHENVMSYRAAKSAGGEITSPDITRRGFMVSVASGFLAVPLARLGARLGLNWNPRLIRPPGALPEADFLNRCIKCGQCMRICPTNIIQPAGVEHGVEALWTPTLNFRIGTSGCQLNCVACGQICPTAAIRPLSLDERLGLNEYAEAGPIRSGMAFIEQGRCLPWAMGTPCIVCQENCPVSPKAIYTREVFVPLRDTLPVVAKADELTVDFGAAVLAPGAFANGDYFCAISGGSDPRPRRITENSASSLSIDSTDPWEREPAAGSQADVLIRLQRPYIDPRYCIGCGICEHECPVSGLKAIRVSAENESREPQHRILA